MRPNRIRELTKQRGMTYPEVAARVRALATARGDAARIKTHTITINRLATGGSDLTQEWMTILGEVFGVSAAEIIAPPLAENLRRVVVTHALEAGKWRRNSPLPESEQFDIMVPSDPALVGAMLYAGEIRGLDHNRRYPIGALVIISAIEPSTIQRPGEIEAGKRYHIRLTRADGMIEDSIRCLAQTDGKLWLKPDSDQPQHQAWIPIAGGDGIRVEIVGRVRGVFLRED